MIIVGTYDVFLVCTAGEFWYVASATAHAGVVDDFVIGSAWDRRFEVYRCLTYGMSESR